MTRFKVLLALLVLLMGATSLSAQETTATLQGVAMDSSGAALPGVSVEAVSAKGQRYQTESDKLGVFRFPAVAPGTYTVTGKLAGLKSATLRNVQVTLGSNPKIDLKLAVAAVAESITVTAEAPLVDVTKSASATSVTRKEIESLPRGRDFTDVVAFTPGAVNDTFLAGGISIDGSTGLENRFVIDGIDTTDPQIGSSAVPMRAEFMEEVQVKTAGYAAEFGGSTGGVINAVTRSGSNSFKGGLLIDYENNNMNSDRGQLARTPSGDGAQVYDNLRKDTRDRWDPGLYLGGPILRDQLWFFGSYQPGITHTERTVNFVNGVTNSFKQDSRVNYATGNVTTIFASKLSMKAGFSRSPATVDGALPSRLGRTTTTATADYATGSKEQRDTYSASADLTATQSFLLSARGGYFKTNYGDVGIPFFDVIQNFSTSGRNPATTFPEIPANLLQPLGYTSHPLYTAATKFDIYKRKSGAADMTYFFKGAGEHALKVGFQTEQISNQVQSGYNADRIIYYWDRSYTTTFGTSQRGKYGYFRLLNISTMGGAQTRNDAIFFQDAWTVLPNLTLNIGIRGEHERVPNYGIVGPNPAIEFKYGDKIAPRLGFAWDPLNNNQWKVYGSYGTYYDVMKYELPRGSFGGDKWVDYYYTFDNPDWTLNSAAGCRVGANNVLVKPGCPAGTLIEAVDRRHNAADPTQSYIDPSLKPMSQWEAQIGVDRQLGANMRIGTRYVHKQVVRAIEDVGILVPGVGEVYYIANPGYGLTTSIAERPFPKAQRKYDALELTFERRFSNRWSFNGSYTYSRLFGNYTGLASADEQNSFGGGARLSPNVSREFDVIQQSYDKNGKFVTGKLPSDRPHQLKGQLMYQFPFQLTAAVNQVLSSGTPITEMALVPVGNFFMPYGRGNLGRTPTYTQTDLALTQNVNVAGRTFQVMVNVINLFDQKAVIHYWTMRNQSDLAISESQFFAGGWDYEGLVANADPDPAYKMPDAWQGARSVRLGVRFNF